MKNKDLIRLINEEISEYDFLNVDEAQNADEYQNLINSKEFQTQLVHDIITKSPNITNWINTQNEVSEPEDDGWGDMVIRYLDNIYEFTYNYQGKPYQMVLQLTNMDENANTDPIPVETEGSYIPATQLQPAEAPEPTKADYSGLRIIIGDESDAIDTDWLDDERNKDLKMKLINSILGSTL